MNVKEMHIGVNLGVQKIASNLNDDLLPQEIDYYLNEAIDDYIKSQYTQLKSERRSKEQEYINENLRTLVLTEQLKNLDKYNFLPRSYKAPVPNEYRFFLYARTLINDVYKNNVKLSQNAAVKLVETPSNSPLFREIPLFIEGNSIIVMFDSQTTIESNIVDGEEEYPGLTINLTYIKNPNRVNLQGNEDCNLPEHTHKEIINMTVGKILQTLNPTQPQRNEN